MSDINIQKLASTDERTLPVFAEAERALQRVRQRAFELFAGRGFGEGRALEDWLTAEHEVCWPAAELVARDKDYVLSVALPGYDAAEVEVTTTPREIIVHAKSGGERGDTSKSLEGKVTWSEFRSNDVYRRVELPADIRVDDVKASLKDGLLKIVAPKAKVATKPVAVAEAA
jgi:HSP20 family molecular chaperone IbpA